MKDKMKLILSGTIMYVNVCFSLAEFTPAQLEFLNGFVTYMRANAFNKKFTVSMCSAKMREFGIDVKGEQETIFLYRGKETTISQELLSFAKAKTVDKWGSTGLELFLKNNQNLHLAAMQGNIESIEMLLEHIKKVKPEDIIRIINVQDRKGWTPLQVAINHGNTEFVKRLLNFIERLKTRSNTLFPLISAQNEDGSTALHFAASQNTEIVEALLNFVENLKLPPDDLANIINIPDSDKIIPLHVAAMGGNVKTIELLLNFAEKLIQPENVIRMITTQDIDGWTLFHSAVQESNIETIQLLLKHIEKLNIQPEDVIRIVNVPESTYGWTPLHIAAMGGTTEIMEVLLDFIASLKVQLNDIVNTKSMKGWMPLHVAMYYGKSSVVRLLLQRRAINNIDTFIFAIEAEHPEIALELLSETNDEALISSIEAYLNENQDINCIEQFKECLAAKQESEKTRRDQCKVISSVQNSIAPCKSASTSSDGTISKITRKKRKKGEVASNFPSVIFSGIESKLDPFHVVFSLTPKQRSTRLDKSMYKEGEKITKKCVKVLQTAGVCFTFEPNGTNHYQLKVQKLSGFVKNFF